MGPKAFANWPRASEGTIQRVRMCHKSQVHYHVVTNLIRCVSVFQKTEMVLSG